MSLETGSTEAQPQPFRYLHPKAYHWLVRDPTACVACGQVRSGYGLVRFTEESWDVYVVCEPCLVAGRLTEIGLRVNDADSEELRSQLLERYPEMQPGEREALAAARTDVVERRTPRPAVLNTFNWHAHCGDYLLFHRQVTAEDLVPLAADGDGKAFLASHLHPECWDADEEFLTHVWEEKLKGFWRFYLWQCLECGDYRLTCDCD